MKPTICLSLAAVALFIGGCSQKTSVSETDRAQFQKELKDEAKRGASSVKGLSSATVRGGQIEIGDAQGRPLWRVQAKELRSQGEMKGGIPQSAVLTQASATLFQAGKPESSFRANTINLFNTAKGVRLQMVGQVVASSKILLGAPIELRAPRADVDVTKRTMSASGGVAAKRGDITLKTPELTGQTSLQTLGCKIATIDARGTTVRGQNALFNWKTNHLSAQKVTATHEKVVLTGQQLEADTAAQRGVITGQVQAKSPKGAATGPRLEFNWKNDRIFVPNALFQGQEAKVQTAALTTDSRLNVTNAQNVRVERDGAVLTIRSARGLENLSRISGSGVIFSRGTLRLEAGSAQTNNWSKDSGSIQASGGVFARTNQGTVRARSATWSGNADSGSVTASGGVQINGQGSTLSGDRGQSDAKFQNAVMSGSVRGKLRDGTRITAGQLEKRGESYVASRGATANLPDGTFVTAARVEGNGDNAVATGGASATLQDGTKVRAGRVEKRGNNVVATSGATATLRSAGSLGRITVTAARVEGNTTNSRVVASGGVVMRAQNGTVVRAPRAIYDRSSNKITATGGVSLVDPVRQLSQTGTSLVADLSLKEVTIANVRGQGQTNTITGKGLF
ncbi:hypothetical protein EON83_09240 [bacterium]|nr:MAG: hypothetical protein EON83_09240 [bacterium]